MRTVGILIALVAITMAACIAQPEARIGIQGPDRAQFEPVQRLLDHRCGSLDCHGQVGRNLRIWGCEGMRLDAMDTPYCRRTGGTDTTAAEYDATYRSLVGLEPAVMTAVIVGKGVHPEWLTFVRKARGDESHKGGALWSPGDLQDQCVASWLAGATDMNACATAISDDLDGGMAGP
jgi:hypothetical protein